MGLNSNELLEYLMGYIDNEIEITDFRNKSASFYLKGEIEGILMMLEVIGLDRMADKISRRYSDYIGG